MKMRKAKKMQVPTRTIRFATPDDNLIEALNAAAVLGVEPTIIDNFYAVLTFPEPYDIIVITDYQGVLNPD